MAGYDKECLQEFIINQCKLYKEPVVRTMGEAAEYLEEVMAVVVNSKQEVAKYMEENGVDISGMTLDEVVNQAEVFKLQKSGRYLIVEA